MTALPDAFSDGPLRLNIGLPQKGGEGKRQEECLGVGTVRAEAGVHLGLGAPNSNSSSAVS
eukprot:1158756-Pelagomonas_calceolata.AAC.12